MEGRPKQRAETFYRKDEDSETAKIQMEDGEIRPDNKTGSLQSSASNRRTDLEPNHHIIKYMPVEVPVHDQYMPEFSDQFPGLNHQDSQELLSRGGTCFDPPLFTCVSPFSIPELTFCQTSTCHGSDCASSEVNLMDEDDITLENKDIFSILNEEYGFFQQPGAQTYGEGTQNGTEILESVPFFDMDSFEALLNQIDQMVNNSSNL